MADVDNALYNAFGQRLISTIILRLTSIAWCWNTTLKIPQARGAGYHSPDQQRRRRGAAKSIAKIEQRFAPLSINHLDQFR